MSSSKITGPLFKWFGSKWSSSKIMPSPRYGRIVEPFAGSAGYSIRYSHLDVTICESNEHIKRLWTWLIQESSTQLVMDIPINIPEGTDIRRIGLSYGQQLLLKNWQRTNNVGNCWTVSPWGNKPGQWTANTRSRVANECYLVKHWRIMSDYTEATESTLEATWFIDPPYQFNYQYGNRPVDYMALAESVKRLNGQVIVCEAVCPKTGSVPQWLPFAQFASRVTSRRKEGCNTHSKELIYEQYR